MRRMLLRPRTGGNGSEATMRHEVFSADARFPPFPSWQRFELEDDADVYEGGRRWPRFEREQWLCEEPP
jgi:hypothetical protein